MIVLLNDIDSWTEWIQNFVINLEIEGRNAQFMFKFFFIIINTNSISLIK